MKLKLLFAFFLMQVAFGQRTCGTDHYMQTLMADPAARAQYAQYEAQFNIELQKLVAQQIERNTSGGNVVNATIRIPVAVHYPSTAGTAAESLKTCLRTLAQNQINILNADYNATNADISNWPNVSDYFPGTNIGNMDVQFVLATQNHPAGTGLANGSPAITFGTDFLTSGDINCTNGCNEDATWAGYLNLVCKNIAGGILGFSRLGAMPNQGMAAIMDNNAFGATATPNCTGYVPGAPYNLGRTLTHELGHYFNLFHTFQGCTNTNCATQGDRICDTPPLDTSTGGCPAIGTVGSCDGNTALTMNYMDYTNDACMYMFTANQATRMLAWYNTIQSQFLTNVLANDEFLVKNFSIAPNPNNGSFAIQLKEVNDNYNVTIFDALGREIYNTDYNQTTELIQEIKIDNALKGLYFISIRSNGAVLNKKVLIE